MCVGTAPLRAWHAARPHRQQLLRLVFLCTVTVTPHHRCRRQSCLGQSCFLVPAQRRLPGPAGAELSVHSFIHSSVKPSLCARDPGSCQVVWSCFHKWLLAAWAGPHLLPLCNLNITLIPHITIYQLSADCRGSGWSTPPLPQRPSQPSIHSSSRRRGL